MSQPRKMENMMQVGGQVFNWKRILSAKSVIKSHGPGRASVNEMSCDKVVDKESYG